MAELRLEEAVKEALEELKCEGIKGWELFVPYTLLDFGYTVRIAPEGDPGPTVKWIPYQGKLCKIGEEEDKEYYVLRLPDTDVWLALRMESDRDVLCQISARDVPPYILSQLQKGGE
jgi:hypothetical protein